MCLLWPFCALCAFCGLDRFHDGASDLAEAGGGTFIKRVGGGVKPFVAEIDQQNDGNSFVQKRRVIVVDEATAFIEKTARFDSCSSAPQSFDHGRSTG